MRILVPALLFLPLFGAGLSLVLGRSVRAQRIVGLVAMTAMVAISAVVLADVDRNGIAVVDVGGWGVPVGITLVVDLFSALLLVISMTMVLIVLVYAIGSPRADDHARFFHPVYLVLAAGVALSFLTGDLFNLFVAFEMTLMASYVLITLGAARPQVRSGMTYVVINLVASLFFIVGLALVYAATGTVNMADLAVKLGTVPGELRTAIGLLFLVVFGIKAAIFPLFFWLPDSYPTAPSPVTAIFAGLLTKVGVYAIVRTQTLLFPTTDGLPSGLLLTIAGLTMVVGVLGAIAQEDMKRILSFHIVSQIGYMILGLGLFSVAGIAGAIFFIGHQIVVKTALFLVAGVVEASTGSAALKKLGGLQHKAPWLAALFFVAAISLAGIPPFSGFVGKLALVQAGLDQRLYVIVGISLAVSLLTLYSMIKIWNGVFWGKPELGPEPTLSADGTRLRLPTTMVWSTAAAVAVAVGIAVAAGPIYELTHQAATVLVERTPYIEAVLDR